MKKCYSFFLLVLLLCTSTVHAQSNRKVGGLVTDTSKIAISEANIMLVAGKDTLRTRTDADGVFKFSNIKAEQFSLKITIIGYREFNNSYTFGKDKSLDIKGIELQFSSNMLKEVVIKTKPNPIRIMQDTLEYNASAYQVLPGDNVADLMKQFPGLEIDEDYNVKTMGKEMIKLRINGKDFFTNNVKDFIGKLPAEIVSKIQIIDDFGDEANFTGIKVGEPVKMLNIVTKPGMNKGNFGSMRVSAGTNDQLGSSGNVNLWKDTQQSSGGLNYGASNNGAGATKNMGLTSSYADKIGKNTSFSLSYNYGRNAGAFTNEQAVETLNPLGTFYNKSFSNGDNKSNDHNFRSTINYKNKKIYLNAALGASYNDKENFSSSINNQSGVLRQDLKNVNESQNKSPRINANVNFSKMSKNKKNNLSANFSISTAATSSNQNIITNTLYYDKLSQVLQKDSLLNRNLITDNNNQNFNFGFNYSLGLKKLKDTLARQSLNFNYGVSVGRINSQVATIVFDNLNSLPSFVDSLSTHYNTTSINQTLGLSYNFSNRKIRYNFGINARPNLLTSNYIHLQQKIKNNTLNYAPNINVSHTIAKGKTLSINYYGSNNNPSLNQLQPIRDAQNLQSTIVGNPNLKPAFNHNINSNFNYVNAKTGISVQSGLSFNAIQNEIVSNVILIPDTLNSLKQETRFENTNGNYSVRSNYMLSIPIDKNKYSIAYSGNLGFNNRSVFINNVKRFNKGVNFSQQLRVNLNSKKITANASTAYAFSSNNNAVNSFSFGDVNPMLNLGEIGGATFYKTHNFRADINSSLRLTNFSLTTSINYNLTNNEGEMNNVNFKKVQSLNLTVSTLTTIKKTFRLGINSSKRINKGYALANTNPLLLGANLTKTFLKSKALMLKIDANDILNQGNNLSRNISGNSIIDSRTNQVTRVFTFGLSYNLSKFGGKSIIVHED